MPATATHFQPIVSAVANVAVASSHDVAAYFGKSHQHVLRDIDWLRTGLSDVRPDLDAHQATENKERSNLSAHEKSPSERTGSYFCETTAMVPMPRGGSREARAFTMTRDGFTLHAMGFTGPKALRFKVAYIEAFNAMERELAERQAAGSKIALMFHADQILTLDDRVIDMEDRITDQGDRIVELESKLAKLAGHAIPERAPHSNTIADTARHIGIKPLALMAELRRRGWIVEDRETRAPVPSDAAISHGWMILHEEVSRLWDGSLRTTLQPRILERGAMILVQEIEV